MPIRKKILFSSNISIAFYILGEFSEAVTLTDKVVDNLKEVSPGLFTNTEVNALVDQPVEVLNNLGVFNLMRGGDYLIAATKLFGVAERTAREYKHTSHRSLLTLLNNLAVFAYAKKNSKEVNRLKEELGHHLKKDIKKKPLYLINLAALNFKQGDHEEADEILGSLMKLADSEEGVQHFDLENLKRIFLLSALNNVKMKRVGEFEKDMVAYKSLLPSIEEDPLSYAKAERMHGIALIKLGQIQRAKKMLENC